LKFTYEGQFPKIADLERSCRTFFSPSLADEDKISLAKYVPHNFEWKWMDPNEIITEKKKKNKELQIKASE
jgi:hypothetical protein